MKYKRNAKNCLVEGCRRKPNTKSWCMTHYQRWRRHGDPSFSLNDRTPEERFWKYVVKKEGCWDWIGGKKQRGYGIFAEETTPKRKNIVAPRFSWKIHYGEIPDGLWVLHYCDNPPCVNPNHLWLGTAKDNSQDMVAKGRSTKGRKRSITQSLQLIR